MGYESLSAVTLVAVFVILLAVWLPRRTEKGMKQVTRHRDDRYSTSLHLVDAQSGTCFSDIETPKAKGAIMPAKETREEKNRAYIEEVRSLRRAAIRRRQTLAAVLVLLTVVVVVLSRLLHFSALYALIPVALLAVVLILGARASRQAREWERKIAIRQERDKAKRKKAAEARARSANMQRAQREALRQAQEEARAQAEAIASSVANEPVQPLNTAEAARNEANTAVMEQREIRSVIREAQLAKAREIAQRRAKMGSAEQPVVEHVTEHVTKHVTEHVTEKRVSDHAQLIVREEDRESGEMVAVNDAESVNAVDLISFSFGEPRNGIQLKTETPQSLEIKSTRQVAKAVPVKLNPENSENEAGITVDPVAEQAAAEPVKNESAKNEPAQAKESSNKQTKPRTQAEETAEAAAEAAAVVDSAEDLTDELTAVKPRKQADGRRPEGRTASRNNARKVRKTTPLRADDHGEVSGSAFHESERSSDVDAPDVTSDSLGASLDNILARRGN